jgi:hypothetical protein
MLMELHGLVCGYIFSLRANDLLECNYRAGFRAGLLYDWYVDGGFLPCRV